MINLHDIPKEKSLTNLFINLNAQVTQFGEALRNTGYITEAIRTRFENTRWPPNQTPRLVAWDGGWDGTGTNATPNIITYRMEHLADGTMRIIRE